MLKRVRPLDAAITIVIIAIIAVGAYLGYAAWTNSNDQRNASPASREIEGFKQKLKQKPSDIDTRMRLAQALAVAGRDGEAVQQYQEILKLNKEFVPALGGIGFEYMKQKDWKNGEKYFRQVIALTEAKTPASAANSPLEVAYYYTGVARMEQKDYAGAAGFLKSALRLKQDASDTSYALAVCYQHLGVPDAYRETLEYTLQFDPKMPEANYAYGVLLLADGDIAGAAEHFRTSSDSAPYKDEPRQALEKLGSSTDRLANANKLASTDASAALAQARVAVALDPQSVDALLLTARLYEKLKKPSKAAAIYQKVLLIDPGNTTAAAGLKRVQHGS